MHKWTLCNDGIGYVALVPDVPYSQRVDSDCIEGDAIADYVNRLELTNENLLKSLQNLRGNWSYGYYPAYSGAAPDSVYIDPGIIDPPYSSGYRPTELQDGELNPPVGGSNISRKVDL